MLGGLKFSVQGTPRDGDTFRISPENHPSLVFRTLVKDGSEVASAAKMTTKASLSNFGTSAADVRLTEPRSATTFRSLSDLLPKSVRLGEQAFAPNVPNRADTLVAASTQPIAVIPAGFSKVVLSTSTIGGELAIFTRDGRQLSGPALTSSDASNVVRSANGFYQGATYSDDYLNRSGGTGYLDQRFIYGAYQESSSQLDTDGNPLLTPATIYGASLDGSAIDLANVIPGEVVDLRINDKNIAITIPASFTTADPSITARERANDLATEINRHAGLTRAVAEATDEGKLVFKSYQEISIAATSLNSTSSITIDGVAFTVAPEKLTGSQTPASYLSSIINDSKSGIVANEDSVTGNLVITNRQGRSGEPIVITENNVGLINKTYFNDAALSVGVPETESASLLHALGLRPGFVMNAPLAEDLLIFGMNSQGQAAPVHLSGTYQQESPAQSLASDSRTYQLTFISGNYRLTDALTGTEVASGQFDTTTRAISYGGWTVSMSGIPADGDSFTILPTDDPTGDNRIAAAFAALQTNRDILDSNQTVQQEYENLVNRMGSLTVQAEIAKDAQQVVFDHARASRDRVSGVNLDEELADLLRYQQAYQANAQVIQVANRLFDSLLQRL
jgi:flagellar hook-associated protein FlgK